MATLAPDDCDALLPGDIAGLDRLSNPVWVFDPARERKLYANKSAIALWGAADLAELRTRDFSVKSDAARIRTEQTLAAVLAGERKADVWTFYPNGLPVSVRSIASHLSLRDGSSAILFETTIIDEPAEYVRALAAVRHAQTIVSLFDSDGVEVFGNPEADAPMLNGRRFLSVAASEMRPLPPGKKR